MERSVHLLGFSAGGHLFGMAAARPEYHSYQPQDALDELVPKVDSVGLIYPVITLEAPYTHTNTHLSLVGNHPSAAEEASWSVQNYVTRAYPPLFMAQAEDDTTSNPENSVIMHDTCRRMGVSVQMIRISKGGHGFGLGKVNPVDTQGVKRMMDAATKANIPLIFVNRKPEVELTGKMAYVGSDSILGGQMEMEALAKKMNYKGNVAILMGALSAEEARQRTKATEDVIAKYKDMKVIEKQSAQWMRNEAVDVTSGWLLSGEKIDAIAANNDEMAIGAIMALGQSGKKDILVAGIDGTPDALQFIKNGKLALTVFQDAAGQGVGAVTMAKQVIDGKNTDKFMWIPYQVITKENYEAFTKKNVK